MALALFGDGPDRQARTRELAGRGRLRLVHDAGHNHGRRSGGDHERDRAPGSDGVPAIGVWLITEPDGTVALELVVMVPTVRPAPVIALVAAACVWFTTLGTDHGRRSGGDHERDRAPGSDRRSTDRRLTDHRPAGTVALELW